MAPYFVVLDSEIEKVKAYENNYPQTFRRIFIING